LFYDQITIAVRGGDGGNGCMAFRREKFIPFGGPSGGNGGGGGSIYLRANSRINTLISFSKVRHYTAPSGGHGEGKSKHGRSAEDVYLDVPLGTLVYDRATRTLLGDLVTEGQTLMVAHGGRGGRGNEVFKTSTRQAPKFAERGEPGEARDVILELKLIADVGLLGKPNAGKSTLLSVISAARPKIADYPFTTLSPSLGMVEANGRSFVVADIPGLIEGAHAGAGLGLQFLRHVERTKLLVHLLDGSRPDPIADYHAINLELALYSKHLAAKPQIVVVTKMDITESRQALAGIKQALAAEDVEALAISAVTGEGIPQLLQTLAHSLDQIPSEAIPAIEVVLQPFSKESKSFTITTESPQHYRVSGEEIERLALMTDWASSEAMERFERILQARGISAALQHAGVQFGDTVYFGSIELEWR
jgi:GTPase